MAAVVLLSGGLDSTVTLGVALRDHPTGPIVALTIAYGQRHEIEVDRARRVVNEYRDLRERHTEHTLHHLTVNVPFAWGGSALTDTRIDVPTDRALDDMAADVPITYVPCRNLIFMALAASVAEARGITTLYHGANQLDYSGYPDCRREFFDALRTVLAVGTKVGVEHERGSVLVDEDVWSIETPLLMLSKRKIIELGLLIEAPLHLTWSCYNPLIGVRSSLAPCGVCDSCKLRAAGFAEAGVVDPALAANRMR